jgi:GcrA cell cycle regulator
MRALWVDGRSAREIADHLGGITRNAVIGRVTRMGLQRRIDPQSNATARVEKVRRARRTRPLVMRKPPPTPPPAPIPVEPLNIPFLDRQVGQCRAVTDATRYEQKVCGHTCEGAALYCHWHRALFYVAPDPKKKPRAR